MDSLTKAKRLSPLFLFAGLTMFTLPLLHPNNTCADWLQKWGQLSYDPMWIPVHQITSAAFAIAAGASLLLAITGPSRALGYFGSAAAGAGYAMMSMAALLHATATSMIGRAYNAATNDAERGMLYVIANAFVSYDVALSGVASALLSGGAVLLTVYLWRLRVFSTPLAVVLAGTGAIWGVQHYRLTRILHFTFPEWVPFVSQGLFLCAIGLVLLLPQREPAVIAAVAPAQS